MTDYPPQIDLTTIYHTWTVDVADLPTDANNDDYPTVPEIPSVSNLDPNGVPSPHTQTVVKTTNWPTINISIPAIPNLSVPTVGRVNDPPIPEEVIESDSLISMTEETYSEDYLQETRNIVIPNPPSITLSVVSSSDVPSFTIDKPNDSMNWVYTEYTSSLLTTLISSASTLLTQELPISKTSVVATVKGMWRTELNFLRSRGIAPLATMESVESQLLESNIDRLSDILKEVYNNINDKNYVAFMQAYENIKLDIYDAKNAGELLYAREFMQVKLLEYEADIAEYNALLNEYRANSIYYQDLIKYENAKLIEYKSKVDAFNKKSSLDSQLIKEYYAQIEIVNNIVSSYKLSMEVAQSISNITILNTEIRNINAQNSVAVSRAAVRYANNETKYREILLEIRELTDVDLQYTQVQLEEEAVKLEKYIAQSQEDLGIQQHQIDTNAANTVRTNTVLRAQNWYDLVISQLNNMKSSKDEAVAESSRQIDNMNAAGVITRDRYVTEAANLERDIEYSQTDLNYEPRVGYLAQLEADRTVYEAEDAAFRKLAEAETSQKLTHILTNIEE